ncbi:MAG: UbiA family prenyltransferase [Candidatus Omnitrophota bacterium]
MKAFRRFIWACEESNVSFGLWLGAALSIIFVRDNLESLVIRHSFSSINSFHLLHVPVFFITLLLSIIILLCFITKEDIVKISKVSLIFFAVIIFPAAVDYLISILTKTSLSYGYVQTNISQAFINFFNPFFNIPEITYGLRLEVFIVSIFSFSYVFLKRNNLPLSLLAGFLVFFLCFGYGSLPGIIVSGFIKFVTFLFYIFHSITAGKTISAVIDERVVVILELIFCVFVILTWFWLYNSRKCLALIKNFRYARVLHYFIMAMIGLVLYFAEIKETNVLAVVRVIALFFGLFFACQFSAVLNDIIDIDCDRLSNNSRPLITGALTKEEYSKVGVVYLALSLLFSFWVSDTCFMINLFFIVIYFLYSALPFKLKRNFISGSLILGLQALLAVLLGQFSFKGPGAAVSFSPQIAWLVFLVFCLSSNIKDLKDSEGDRHSDVYSLPVIFGEKKSRKIIGFFVFISYVLVPVFLNKFFYDFRIAVLSFLFGLINYQYIKKQDSQERLVFIMYFVYVLIVFLFLL